MSVTINSFAKKAYSEFIKSGMTPQGASGMLGNIYAESGMIANRVEILCLKRIKEYYGTTYTDETYTTAVNNGKITRAQFLNPLPSKQYGYGAIQWTSPNRKAGLYDRTVAKGKSIADEDEQISYIIYELKNSYPSVWKVLTTATTIKEASDKVLKDFESPANWSSYSSQRVSYSQEYYDQLKTTTVTKGSDVVATNDKAINALIATAQSEIGYLEKASNSQLDSKTGNAGSNNYTKYWRDVYSAYQAQPWCACFVSWCMMKTFGLDTAKKLLKHWPYTYCPTLASMTTNKTPKVGSVIIFYRNGEYVHTGLVTAVSGNIVTTIEGNTSGGSTIIANGGGVCQKKYDVSTLSSATKYFMPDYSIVTTINGASTATTPSTATTTTSSKESPWKAKLVRNAKVRTWAGNEYKEVSFSPLKKNTEIEVQYSLKANDGTTWYYFKYTDKFAFIAAEEVEKVVATTTTTTNTVTTEKKKTQYRVQAGVYAVKANAKSTKATLKKAGYEPIIVSVNQQYIVQLGMFENQQNALNLKKQLNADGFDAAVIAIKS